MYHIERKTQHETLVFRGEGGAPPLGAQEVPPEWVSNCVYLLLAVLQEYIYSISCLSLLLTRDLFRVLPRTARCW